MKPTVVLMLIVLAAVPAGAIAAGAMSIEICALGSCTHFGRAWP